MSNLDVFYLPVRSVDRADDTVDTIAGITVDAADTPFRYPLNQEIANCHAHKTIYLVGYQTLGTPQACSGWAGPEEARRVEAPLL